MVADNKGEMGPSWTSANEVVKILNRRLEALRNDFSSWSSTAGEIQANLLPNHGRNLGSGNKSGSRTGSEDNQGGHGYEDAYGGDNHNAILDPTASQTLRDSSAGMLNGTASQSVPWLKLGAEGVDIEEDYEAKQWLYDAERTLLDIFAKSNYYRSVHSVLTELLGFGTGCMMLQADFEDVINTKAYTYGEYYLAQDSKGMINTVYRVFAMTTEQLVDEFGRDRVSSSVLNAYDNNNLTQMWDVVHAVEFNDTAIRLPELKGKRWRSIYFESASKSKKGGECLLRVEWFEEFPSMGPRWDTVSSQVWGRGPGHDNLNLIKGLQKQSYNKQVIADKIADPPVVSPGEENDLTVNSFPGGITYEGSIAAPGTTGNGIRSLYAQNPDASLVMEDIQDLRALLRKGFFADLFAMLANLPDSPQRTAFEIAARQREALTRLGPVLERLHKELFTPSVERTFNIMMRMGVLPDPPPSLEDRDIKIEYVSILAQAQKAAGLGATEGLMNFAGSLASVKPSVLDKIDFDEAVDIYAQRVGAPPSLVVPDDVVAQEREARAQQAQMQQQMLAAESVSKTAETLSNAEPTGQNVLGQMMGTST